MGQIVSSAAKPKRCNANQLSQVPTPAAGEHILVSSDNSMNAAGQGNFDSYIIGDGTTAATALELKKIDGGVYDAVFGKTETQVDYVAQELLANKYCNTNNNIIPAKGNLPSYTGHYCCYISVAEGEKYRIFGKGMAAATQLYVLANSSRSIITKSGNLNTRENGLEIIIPADIAFLVVNLTDYDATTDKVEKVITTEIQCTGLIEEVAGIQEDMTNLDAEVERVEGRIDGTTTTEYIPQALTADKGLNTNNNIVPASPSGASSVTGCYLCYVFVEEGEKYRIYGNGPSVATQLYVFAGADRLITYKSGAMNTRENGIEVTIPSGVSIMCVNLYQYDSSTDKVEKIVTTTEGGVQEIVQEYVGENCFPLSGKKIVSFGDSVWEFTQNGKGIIEYLKEISKCSTIYKGAIGGSRLVTRTTPVENPTDNNTAYAALDIDNLVGAWANNNWTYVDNAVTYLKNNAGDDNTEIINNLKSCPIADTDIVLVTGGANDSRNGVPLGTSDTSATSTSCGALASIIQTILAVNPKIQIFYVSPIVRYVSNMNPPDSQYWCDTWQNSKGVTLATAAETLMATAKYHHIPFIDIYWGLGWNQTNFLQYFPTTDLTHPFKGFRNIAQKVYSKLISNL